MGVFVAVFLASWVASLKVVPRDSRPGGSDPRPAPGGRLPGFIYRLAGYGFLLGAGGSTIFTFLPLYGQEVLRLSAQTTGLAVGLMGLVGVVARIYWARSAELSLGSVRALRAIAWLAAAAAGALLVAPRLGPVGLWVGAALTGVSASAWNSVGMLAIIESLPPVAAGRGSGVVLLGFLAGLAVGAPAFGWSIDRIGVYEPGWLVVGLVFLAGWMLLRRAVAPLGRSWPVSRLRRPPIGGARPRGRGVPPRLWSRIRPTRLWAASTSPRTRCRRDRPHRPTWWLRGTTPR
ncbi:MAG: hypothetical protein KatS3mg011_0246 [Acidimicrobiia bacterium]|nr:MAG: hypothetical protein KatS3mg011_0246 [Acidimicrobiia bacterium]